MKRPTRRARRARPTKDRMRKDPRFVIPTKRTDAIQYLEAAPASKGGGVEELKEAVGLAV